MLKAPPRHGTLSTGSAYAPRAGPGAHSHTLPACRGRVRPGSSALGQHCLADMCKARLSTVHVARCTHMVLTLRLCAMMMANERLCSQDELQTAFCKGIDYLCFVV